MLQDGRRYLVYCMWPSQSYWEIVRWGVPAGVSDPNAQAGWLLNNGLRLREDTLTFGRFFELDSVISLITKEEDYLLEGNFWSL